MSISASDIVIYGSANMQESDSGTQGGAIDTTVRIVFADSTLANTLNDTLEVLSSNAGDTTQTVTVYGRNSAGSIISEAFALNGTTVVNGATTFERILKIVVSASHTGTITVRKATGDTAVASIESGVLTIRRPFYNVSAEASGGSTKTYYEKMFVKNNNSSNALIGATFADGGGDSNNYITFALEDAVSDTGTSTDRITAPSAGTIGTNGFTSSSKTLAAETDAGTADLGTSTAIGLWLKMALPAGSAAGKDTWTLTVSGSTT
jgi:hypothetical protein